MRECQVCFYFVNLSQLTSNFATQQGSLHDLQSAKSDSAAVKYIFNQKIIVVIHWRTQIWPIEVLE